jgi:hypothetical protein
MLQRVGLGNLKNYTKRARERFDLRGNLEL